MRQVAVVVKKNEEKILPFVWFNDTEDIELEVRLVGEGASVKILGIFFGSGQNSFVFNTRVLHEAPKTKSLTTLRGVFKDVSSFANDGLVSIQKGAKGADGYFVSKVLLFDNAKGKSIPSLEIDENDLKAGHASTVGRPDEEQLFYLQSRGLSEKEAIKLIIAGFFTPILSQFSNPDKKGIEKRLHRIL